MNIKIKNLEARVNNKESHSPRFEIVCWKGWTCLTIATFDYITEGFQMTTAYDRVWGDQVDPLDFMWLSKTFIDILNSTEKYK